MSRTYSSRKHVQQKHPKVYFEQYLRNVNEPLDDNSYYSPAELEAELLENTYGMKHQVRRIAQGLRNLY